MRSGLAGRAADRAPNLVDRDFGADAPNQLCVADFACVPMASGGLPYTAFVSDAYAGTIAGSRMREQEAHRVRGSRGAPSRPTSGSAGATRWMRRASH